MGLVTSDEQPTTTTSITLSWSPLTTQTDDNFTYNIGYITDIQCNNSVITLPDEYTVFGNTTGNSIVVTGLQPGTCYVFGVRVYTSKSKDFGKWTTLYAQTKRRMFQHDTKFMVAYHHYEFCCS